MAQQASSRAVTFETRTTAGDARAGMLRVGSSTIETPNLFPVVNFYAGGMERSVFGGGVHRTIKEFMIGAERTGGDIGCTPYFDATMTSVSSLTDYNITQERFESYLATPVKDRELFAPFDGVLFVDSGGFKFLDSAELDGSDFEVEMDQQTVYEIQRQMGADIIVNLDRPIAPEDSHADRVRKARQTAENIEVFLNLSGEFNGGRFLTLHGYNYSMMDEFLETVTEIVPAERLRSEYNGIALGSLVPKKDNRAALIRAVTDCHEIMADWGFADFPLHILGISSRAVPLLAALGVDSFDSSTHLHNAINGKYHYSIMENAPLDEADFSACDCPVCSSEELVARMQGDAEYRKDILGPVAMHNLIVQKRELADIRACIHADGTEPLIEYLEETFSQDKTMRRYAHQVVNQSLGGYF